jgi:hypothetical protein
MAVIPGALGEFKPPCSVSRHHLGSLSDAPGITAITGIEPDLPITGLVHGAGVSQEPDKRMRGINLGCRRSPYAVLGAFLTVPAGVPGRDPLGRPAV